MAKAGLSVTRDRVADLIKGLRRLPTSDVLVGVPAEQANRQDSGEPMNNATLAFIHNTGATEANIPARPFMEPGIKAATPQIIKYFKQAGQATLDSNPGRAARAYEAAGLAAVNKIRMTIVAGLPPPLADSTLKARARRAGKGTGVSLAKGAQQELASRAAGNAPSTQYAKPLIDTAQMEKSITYVVRGSKPEMAITMTNKMKGM